MFGLFKIPKPHTFWNERAGCYQINTGSVLGPVGFYRTRAEAEAGLVRMETGLGPDEVPAPVAGYSDEAGFGISVDNVKWPNAL